MQVTSLSEDHWEVALVGLVFARLLRVLLLADYLPLLLKQLFLKVRDPVDDCLPLVDGLFSDVGGAEIHRGLLGQRIDHRGILGIKGGIQGLPVRALRRYE
jgi:hypothetical protein